MYRVTWLLLGSLALSGACTHTDEQAAAFNKAGTEALDRGENDAAITQFDRAILVKHQFAEAFKSRAVAYEAAAAELARMKS